MCIRDSCGQGRAFPDFCNCWYKQMGKVSRSSSLLRDKIDLNFIQDKCELLFIQSGLIMIIIIIILLICSLGLVNEAAVGPLANRIHRQDLVFSECSPLPSSSQHLCFCPLSFSCMGCLNLGWLPSIRVGGGQSFNLMVALRIWGISYNTWQWERTHFNLGKEKRS